MGAPGGVVFFSAWLVVLLCALGLRRLRRPLLPALGVASVFAVMVLVETARIGDTITRTDVVAVFSACLLGALCAVAPLAYIRWVRSVLARANADAVRR